MVKFLLTYTERSAVTYEVEAADESSAWDGEFDLDDTTEVRREIVANEIVMVQLK